MEIEFYFKFKRKPKTKKVTLVVDEGQLPSTKAVS